MDIFLAHNTLWTPRGGQWLLQMAVSYFSNNIQEITLIFTLDEVTSLDLFKNFFPFMSLGTFPSETVFFYLVFQKDTVLPQCIRGKFLVACLSRLTTELTFITTDLFLA